MMQQSIKAKFVQYGMKIWAIFCSKTKYLLNLKLYLEKASKEERIKEEDEESSPLEKEFSSLFSMSIIHVFFVIFSRILN